MPVLDSQWHSMGISGAPVLDTIDTAWEDPIHGLGALETVYGKPQKTVWASDDIVCEAQSRGFRAPYVVYRKSQQVRSWTPSVTVWKSQARQYVPHMVLHV